MCGITPMKQVGSCRTCGTEYDYFYEKTVCDSFRDDFGHYKQCPINYHCHQLGSMVNWPTAPFETINLSDPEFNPECQRCRILLEAWAAEGLVDAKVNADGHYFFDVPDNALSRDGFQVFKDTLFEAMRNQCDRERPMRLVQKVRNKWLESGEMPVQQRQQLFRLLEDVQAGRQPRDQSSDFVLATCEHDITMEIHRELLAHESVVNATLVVVLGT